MTTIGTFQKVDAGYAGTIKTLSVATKARIIPMERPPGGKAPDFRIYSGSGNSLAEVGAAWKRTAKATGMQYLSCRIDDPSFPGPLYAVLTENAGNADFSLIWSRAKD